MTEENKAEPDSESRSVYLRFRKVFGNGASRSSDARKRAKREPGSSAPFGSGRDPEGLGSVMDALTSRLGWNSPLAQSELLASWNEVAGAETAEHSTPVGIEEGVLTVRCDSTAWATQLRLMRVQIATRIADRYPDAGIVQVRFAYGQVAGSLTWFVNAYQEIARWRANIERLARFADLMDHTVDDVGARRGITRAAAPAGALRLDDLRLESPNGEVLVGPASAQASAGTCTAIRPSGLVMPRVSCASSVCNPTARRPSKESPWGMWCSRPTS